MLYFFDFIFIAIDKQTWRIFQKDFKVEVILVQELLNIFCFEAQISLKLVLNIRV